MRDDFQIWVDAVCEQVRFWPDRQGLAKELRVHYEDHRKALEQLHYEPELAAERSLRAMGNAQEVGWALDRVHKPWLGWLWESSRWLARGMAALLVITMLCSVNWGLLIRCTWDELAWEEPPAGTACVELEHGTLWAAPGDVTREPDGTTVAEIDLWLQRRDPLGVDRTEYYYRGLWNEFFTYGDEQGELTVRGLDKRTMMPAYSRYWRNKDAWGRGGWTRWQKTVELVLDEPPRWAEISYPLSGRDWVLRVEWAVEP